MGLEGSGIRMEAKGRTWCESRIHSWGLQFCHCWGVLVLLRVHRGLGMVEKTWMGATELVRVELTYFTA